MSLELNVAKRIFEFIYPDYGGNTFFSIIVWEGIFEQTDTTLHDGWTRYIRFAECRYVIMGRLLEHVTDIAESDQQKWDSMVGGAEALKRTWFSMFTDFESKYKEASEKCSRLYKEAGYGLSWDNTKKEIVIHPPRGKN